VVCISGVVKRVLFLNALSSEDYNPDVGRILRPQILKGETLLIVHPETLFLLCIALLPFVSLWFSHPLLAKAIMKLWEWNLLNSFEVI